jgi:precorrin-6y C5,15-methyltransferase (decarboxylating) CbiE subunit/precorrin-6Y C5,15-methyltransferase (decarboxylating) CbiT subunit
VPDTTPHLFALPDPGDAGPTTGPSASSATITVIGLADDRLELLAPEALEALAGADLVVGGRRHLALWRSWLQAPAGRRGIGPVPGHHVADHAGEEEAATGAQTKMADSVEVGADIEYLVGLVRQRAVEAGERVCVLASGDPGFFGIVRSLLRAIDRRSLRVLPAASSISLAFSRLGLPWDDAVVVSAHGRSLPEAVNVIRTVPKAAVLTSPESPPEAVARSLLDAGVVMDLVAVCSRLGAADEEVAELTLEELAAGRYDPLSVVVLVGPGGLPLVGWQSSGPPDGNPVPGTVPRPGPPTPPARRVLAWGLPDGSYIHRGGMLTKAEVRSVVLGKLALPSSGVLWDLGAGAGSVAIECALLQPGLTVLALESSSEDAARISANAEAAGAGVHVVCGQAPEALDGLPAPDRVFVGGGGIPVLEAAMRRLRPGGRLVATFAAIDRAAAAADLLGNLVQVGIDHGQRLPAGGWRLAAANPVFVAWGPGGEEATGGEAVPTATTHPTQR